jgi:serine/threonine-protein kinase
MTAPTLDPHEVPCPSCGGELATGGICARCDKAQADPRVGLVLADKYVIDDVIASGGMGTVYRATHLELGEPVAVKFLLGPWAQTVHTRTRFRREAVALARLRHPGVVSVLDFGEHGSDLYLVMEFVKGTMLASVLDPPMPLLRLGPIFDQILQVLEAAHAAKIVHRDIKPSNVMLTDTSDRADRVKVLDFGLVRLDDTQDGPKLTQTGQVHGTPHYMSPEQCRGIDVGSGTDVYAVGVMLYEALTGEAPFQGDNFAVILSQHMFVDPPPLASIGSKPTVSTGLEEVVRAALAKRAEDRPSAAELRDRLGAALRGTDPASMAERAAAERKQLALLSRSERALTGVHRVAASEPSSAGDRVILWMAAGPRASELRNGLAMDRCSTVVEAGEAVPAAEGGTKRVILLSANDDGAGRLARLRGNAASASTPVLVIDAPGAAETAALIRAGASDVTLDGAGTDEILRKARRLLARGR